MWACPSWVFSSGAKKLIIPKQQQPSFETFLVCWFQTLRYWDFNWCLKIEKNNKLCRLLKGKHLMKKQVCFFLIVNVYSGRFILICYLFFFLSKAHPESHSKGVLHTEVGGLCMLPTWILFLPRENAQLQKLWPNPKEQMQGGQVKHCWTVYVAPHKTMAS